MPMTLRDFENQLIKAKTLAALDKVLADYLGSYHITGYTFTYFGLLRNTKHKLLHEVVSPRMLPWHRYYHESGYEETDPILHKASKSLVPLYWCVADDLKKATTEKDRKMRQESLDYGVTEGASIPVHGAEGDFAELVLRQFKDETCLENYGEDKYAWQMAAFYYYHHLRSRLLKQLSKEELYALSKRELQCLELLNRGSTVPEMAVALSMTERTVQFHIQNINRKLGTKNKYQSLEKAKTLGLLKNS